MTTPHRRESEVLVHTAPDGPTKPEGHFEDESAWLSETALAEPFGVGAPAIAKQFLKSTLQYGNLSAVGRNGR